MSNLFKDRYNLNITPGDFLFSNKNALVSQLKEYLSATIEDLNEKVIIFDNHPLTLNLLAQEFEKYNISLLNKPEIILLTKIDLADKATVKKNSKILEKKGKKVLTASIYNPESLNFLKKELLRYLDKLPRCS